MGLLDEADPGDDAAFAEVYERTCTPVYLEVLRVLRAPAPSDEVTQEV
jgi:hypothetical protein